MKFVGIVGSNAEQSYNRMLLEFIRKNFKTKFELEVLEIDDIPMFNQVQNWEESFQLRLLNNKITRADGVIIATPEHNHTITAALKSVLEWLSFAVHPLENKPVMIVGALYYDQGTSRAQIHLRKILDAPGVNAYTLPGNEFLLGKAKEAFDDNGNIINPGTVQFLETCLDNFIKYVGVVSSLRKPKAIESEDLYCQGQPDPDTMLGKRVREQVGNRMATVHGSLPPARMKNVEWVIGTLRNGNQEYVRTVVPGTPPEVINTHNYQAMYYPDGSYAGINEIIFNFKPWLDWYLQTTGQRLVGGTTAAPGASAVDTTSSASTSTEDAPVDQATDATSGASEH